MRTGSASRNFGRDSHRTPKAANRCLPRSRGQDPDAFAQAEDAFDKPIAKRLRDDIMSVGNSVDFRGRDPRIDGLLRARGFAAQP